MDPGSLFGGSIVAVDPDKPGGSTTNQTLVSNHRNLGPDLFEAPLGLTVSPSGRIFVADAGVPGVIAVDRDGQQRLVSASDMLASPVAIDLAPGPRLFVADAFGLDGRDGSIIRVDPANGQQSLVAAGVINETDDLVRPSGIVVSQPTIFIADRDSQADRSGAVIATSLTGGKRVVASNAGRGPDLFTDPSGIAFDGRGEPRRRRHHRRAGPPRHNNQVAPGTGQMKLLSRGADGLDGLVSARALTVVPARCAGRAATLIGTTSRDRLRGTPGRDVIAGLGGNDAIEGRGGNDVLCGGAGRDTIRGGGGRDTLRGGPGPRRRAGLARFARPGGLGQASPSYIRSTTVAMAMPPAAHMVSRPQCRSSVRRSLMSVVMMRAPVLRNGWPRAMAPPCGLSWRSMSIPVSRTRQDLGGERLVELDDVDVADGHAGLLEHLATASMGRRP